MKKYLQIAFTIILVALSFTSIYGQEDHVGENTINMTIPEVSLISFEGGERIITHNSENDGQINQIITPPTTESWINYASIVEAGARNEITVQISSGFLPPDVQVKIRPGAYTGDGKGDIGEPAQEVALSRYPKAIIKNIGSCFTGKGANNGHKLVYSWETTNESVNKLLESKDYSITVTYTIKSAL